MEYQILCKKKISVKYSKVDWESLGEILISLVSVTLKSLIIMSGRKWLHAMSLCVFTLVVRALIPTGQYVGGNNLPGIKQQWKRGDLGHAMGPAS